MVESSDVVVAPMVDQAADNGIASEDLCSSYSVSGTVNGDVHTIKITAKDVMLHTNQQQVAGHWVGFGIPAQKRWILLQASALFPRTWEALFPALLSAPMK